MDTHQQRSWQPFVIDLRIRLHPNTIPRACARISIVQGQNSRYLMFLFSLTKRPFSAKSTYLGSEVSSLCDVLSSVRVSSHSVFLNSLVSTAQIAPLMECRHGRLGAVSDLCPSVLRPSWYTLLTLYLLAYAKYSLTCPLM